MLTVTPRVDASMHKPPLLCSSQQVRLIGDASPTVVHRGERSLPPLPLELAMSPHSSPVNRLVGLVVKASASRVEGPGFESRLRRDFFRVDSYQ